MLIKYILKKKRKSIEASTENLKIVKLNIEGFVLNT